MQSLDVDLYGHQFAVDLGAQFFHPGPYPVYTALLESLDLFPPARRPPSPWSDSRHRSRSENPANDAAVRRADHSVAALADVQGWNLPGLLAFATASTQRRPRTEQRELVAHARRLAADTRSVAVTVGSHHPSVGGVAVFG